MSTPENRTRISVDQDNEHVSGRISLLNPPKCVGKWIINPLKGGMGNLIWPTVNKPRWIVRFFAKHALDCVWEEYK